MMSLLKFLVEKFNIFYSILFISFLFFMVALIFYYYDKKKLSFFFLYVGLTYAYFFILLKVDASAILLTYGYYFLIFLAYHFYFTFSKLFYLRSVAIIKKYLYSSNYLKLILWVYFIFVCSLFGNSFIFLMVFNPLLLFSIATGNLIFSFFLLVLWGWMFILIFCNKWNIWETKLLKIQDYFSREAILHFIGNKPGRLLCQRVGAAIVCTPIVVSVPAMGGYALEKESQTANYAIGRMESYTDSNPNCTNAQQYKVYCNSYKAHANSSIVGRQLTSIGVMQPAAPEAIIPNYNTGLADSLKEIEK